jgi:hypothetical protein
MVNIERIKVGNRQTIDTLISEEALLFSRYLRGEKKEWVHRVGTFHSFSHLPNSQVAKHYGDK